MMMRNARLIPWIGGWCDAYRRVFCTYVENEISGLVEVVLVDKSVML